MIASSALLIAACDVPTQSHGRGDGTRNTVGTTRIELDAESFNLAWNPDEEREVESYELAFRERGESVWQELGTVPGDVTRYEVHADELGTPSGTFEFAVRSVSPEDGVSDYHESTAPDARPEGGWYLDLQ